jgi:16S rRNA U516 pseudouridylate synthase RsuA-like enzyme
MNIIVLYRNASMLCTYSCRDIISVGGSSVHRGEPVKLMRLERIIANRGVGSRNDVAKLLKQGRVSINGKVVRSGASKYDVNTVIAIDGEETTEVRIPPDATIRSQVTEDLIKNEQRYDHGTPYASFLDSASSRVSQAGRHSFDNVG